MKKPLSTIIMAAGKGTRMLSDLPKVLHELKGKTLLQHVVNLSKSINSNKTIIVVGYKKEMIFDSLKNSNVEFAVQEEILGTGHAVMQAEESLKDFNGNVLVLSGDVPVLTKATLENMIKIQEESESICTILSAEFDEPLSYGRIIRDEDSNNVLAIVEKKDATPEQELIKEINSGIYIFDCQNLFKALKNINTNNAQNEYYLTDVIEIFVKEGKKVSAYITPDPNEIRGVNTKEQLDELEMENL